MKNQLIEYNITNAVLAEFAEKYTGLKASDAKEYQVVVKALSDIRSTRTGVEKTRKELKADALEYGRKVDAEAKSITDALLLIEEPLRAEKDAYDAEKQRQKEEKERLERECIANIQRRIAYFSNEVTAVMSKPAIEMEAVYNALEKEVVADAFDYMEFKEEAGRGITAALERLENAIIEKRGVEAAQREEAERVARQAEENRIAQAKIDAERAELEAQKEALAKEKAEVARREILAQDWADAASALEVSAEPIAILPVEQTIETSNITEGALTEQDHKSKIHQEIQ